MFPKVLLDVEFIAEENSLEMYLLIRKTTEEIRMKQAKLKERQRNIDLFNKFIHAMTIT